MQTPSVTYSPNAMPVELVVRWGGVVYAWPHGSMYVYIYTHDEYPSGDHTWKLYAPAESLDVDAFCEAVAESINAHLQGTDEEYEDRYLSDPDIDPSWM